MCGILAIFEASTNDVELRKRIVSLAKRLRHRGPDAVLCSASAIPIQAAAPTFIVRALPSK